MEKIIVAGLELENEIEPEAQFEETLGLAKACGMEVVGRMIQKRRTPHPATYFGQGKVAEIKEMIQETKATACMISKAITPSQMRSLKDALGVRVFDRNDCILEIFGKRANTKQAKLQVELATLKHELPYVIHTEQNFSRMRGGNKNKGEGEKQYQLNQRKLEIQIQKAEKALKEVKKSQVTMKKKRNQSDLKMISLVGYTNAGKSTFMNQILQKCEISDEKQVFVKDMLFATLDTSVRKISYQGVEFLLSDTVGFVSNLPHELVDAFHSTLESVVDADLILQVVDESSEQKLHHMKVTQETLEKLHADETAMWVLHNKCDCAEFKDNEKGHFYISASIDQGVDEVLEAIIQFVKQDTTCMTIEVPYENQQIYALIHKYATLLETIEKDDTMEMKLEVKNAYLSYFVKYKKIEKHSF